MRIHGVFERVTNLTPDMVEQFRARENATGGAGKVHQQVEFSFGQRRCLAMDGYGPIGRVDAQGAEAQRYITAP